MAEIYTPELKQQVRKKERLLFTIFRNLTSRIFPWPLVLFPLKTRIVVLGYMVRGPLGGLIWHHLHMSWGWQSWDMRFTFLRTATTTPRYNPQDDSLGTDQVLVWTL